MAKYKKLITYNLPHKYDCKNVLNKEDIKQIIKKSCHFYGLWMICFHANIEVREKLEEKGDIEIRDGEKTTRASKRMRRRIFGRPMEVAEGYKVARRRDDDIAIVTAGLRIRTEASPEVARASE